MPLLSAALSPRAPAAAHTASPYAMPPLSRRRRQPIACTRCRSRKVRCDGNRPACGPCIAHGLAAACCFVSKKALRTTTASASLPYRAQHVSMHAQRHGPGRGHEEPWPVGSARMAEAPITSHRSAPHPPPHLPVALPITPRLLHVYLETFNPLFAFVHPDDLAVAVDAPLRLSIYALGLLALASSSSNHADHQGNLHIAHECARRARPTVHAPASLASVQCLLNLVLWAWMSCRVDEARGHLRIALRMARELGLDGVDRTTPPPSASATASISPATHPSWLPPASPCPSSSSFSTIRLPSMADLDAAVHSGLRSPPSSLAAPSPPFSPRHMETRRRCWWALYQLDCLLALTDIDLTANPPTLRAPLLHNPTIHTYLCAPDSAWLASSSLLDPQGSRLPFCSWLGQGLPSTRNPLLHPREGVSWRNHLTELCALISAFLRPYARHQQQQPDNPSPTDASDHLNRLEDALARWRRLTPSVFATSITSSPVASSNTIGALFVRTLYWTLCLIIAWVRASSPSCRPELAEARLLGITMSIACVAHNDAPPCHPWMSFCLYVGAMGEARLFGHERDALGRQACTRGLHQLRDGGCGPAASMLARLHQQRV